MGQIISEKAIATRCNLAAIQSGGSKASEVLAEDEIWLVDTTNASKGTDGYGLYDAYIKGDGTTAASSLTVNKIQPIDNYPTSGSDNPVKSGGVYTMLGYKQDTLDNGTLIYIDTTSRPTPIAKNELGNTVTTVITSSDPNSGWNMGYDTTIPSTGLVKAKLAAKQDTISDLSTIRSGAAAGATAVQPAAMNTALASKQDTLTFDSTPTANSNNPVKSGGVKTAIDAKQDTISTVNVTVDNNTGTPSGTASVSGSTLSLSFQNLKGATGAQGPQGIQGVQGVQGPKGDTGVTGDASSLAIIHGIDKTSSYGTTDVCGADAAQALLNEIEGGFYY